MSHSKIDVLRLFLEGSEAQAGWVDRKSPYGNHEIEQIEDPSIPSDSKELTSVPSPFARLQLTQAAFDYVARRNQLDGKTIYHKLVSDALDIGQILFQWDQFQSKFELIRWTLQDLEILTEDRSKRLADTLRLFWSRDGQSFQFDKTKSLYLLRYIGKGAKPVDIIGGLSPLSLYATTANDKSYLRENSISFGADKPLDDQYCALYNRNRQYIQYLLWMDNRYNFASLFPELHRYLDKTRERLGHNVDIPEEPRYLPIQAARSKDSVTFMGIEIPCRNPITLNRTARSAFMIKTERRLDQPPLALPSIRHNIKGWTYVEDVEWDTEWKIPPSNPVEIARRQLPEEGTPYPYLVTNDLLADSLIAANAPINDKQYWNPCPDEKMLGFLYPVTPLFFHYFTPEYLTKNLTAKRVANNSIEVSLKIHVAGDGHGDSHIVFQRTYSPNPGDVDRETLNYGSIVPLDFTVALFPHLAYPEGVAPLYRVTACPTEGQVNGSLSFYTQSGDPLKSEEPLMRRIETEAGAEQHPVYCLDATDDPEAPGAKWRLGAVQINIGRHSGVLIPKFEEPKPIDTIMRFAVDFGTSNTHIEQDFIRNGRLDMKPQQLQLAHNTLSFLHECGPQHMERIYPEFIPDKLGERMEFGFPTRSALLVERGKPSSAMLTPYGDAGLCFQYEKRLIADTQTPITGLKWTKREEGKEQLRTFINSLLLLMRISTIQQGGELERSELVWFYPTAMLAPRRAELNRIWSEGAKRYFGLASTVKALPEAIAPTRYQAERAYATLDALNIDIGGGTTDIVYLKNDETILMASSLFGADYLYEPLYSVGDKPTLGLFRATAKEWCEELEKGKGDQVLIARMMKRIADDASGVDKGARVVSLLYGLANNRVVREAKLNFSLSKRVRDNAPYKFLFLTYYAAVVYNCARLLKVSGENMNLSLVTFSGNGARLIEGITIDEGILTGLTRYIFGAVLGRDFPKLRVELPDEKGKRLTAQGGLVAYDENVARFEDYVRVLVPGGDDFAKERTLKEVIDSIQTGQSVAGDADEAVITLTANEVREFFSILFGYHAERRSFQKDFDIDRICIEIAQKAIGEMAIEGMVRKNLPKGDERKEEMRDTLFFLPFDGIFKELLTKLTAPRDEA